MSDDARKIIMARRARFIAAAVAGMGIACGRSTTSAEPCLSIRTVPSDAEPPLTPMPCLSVAVPVAADAAPPPMACLSPLPMKSPGKQ